MIFAAMSRPSFPAFATWPAISSRLRARLRRAARFFRAPTCSESPGIRASNFSMLPDVCFALRDFIPQPDEIRAAMRKTLGDVPGMRPRKSRFLLRVQHAGPAGELVFPRSGLQLPSGNQQGSSVARICAPWREGDFPVWARVRVIANTTRVVADGQYPERQAHSGEPGPPGKL